MIHKKNKKLNVLLWIGVLCLFGNAAAQTGSIQLKTGTGTLVNSYNSVQAAYNAIPATLTQGYIIEITSTYTGANETYPITFPAKTAGHSAANTIIMRPAAGVTNAAISGVNNTGSILVLDGVKFFTLDGRAGGTGSSRNFSIINNTTSAGNTVAHTILATKGSSNLTIRYMNIVNTADLLGTKNLCFLNNTAPMKNVLVEYCKVSLGRTGIGVEGATSAIIDSMVIRANIIESWSFAGIWRFGSVANLTIDSNMIYQPIVSTQSPHGGLLLDGSGTAGTLNITRNRIYSLQANSEVTGIFLRNMGGQDVNIINNLVSVMAPNGSTSPVYGISSTGSAVNNVKVYYNTIRVAGNYTGSAAAGAINSSGINKTNSATTATYDFKNNIVVNTRTGGNGVRHAALTISNTNGTITANNNSYYSSTGDLALMGTMWFNNINDYRAAILAPNENASNVYLATFDSANSMVLDPAHYGDYNLVATPMPQYGTDILGNTRNALYPYRGAYEAPVPVDPNMVYRTSTSVQKDSSYVNRGAIRQLLLRVEVNVTGVLNPITIDDLSFSLNGTTSLSDISSLRVFYTGLSAEYRDTMQYGGTINSVTNTFTVSGSLVPMSGRNYFWLAADISNNAVLCNLVDAQFTSLTVGGQAKTPTVTDPAGFLRIKTYMSGTYTINPLLPALCVASGENFKSFKEFVFNLNERGIDGNVNLEVAAGTYPESVEFTPYFTTDTTFEVYVHSANNNAASVIMSLPASIGGAPYLVSLSKVSGLRFEHMTFRRTGSVDNAVAFNLDGAANVIIRNNIFQADSSNTANNTTGSNSFISSNASSGESNILVEKNTFAGNSNGIWILGASGNYSTGIRIVDNRFKNGYTAIFMQYAIAPEISRNHITRVDSNVTTNYFGVSLLNVNGKFIIDRNEMIFHNSIGYGIRLRSTVALSTDKGLITNNLVQMNGSGASYGISLEEDSKFARVYNNTVYILASGTATTSRALYVNTAGIQGMEIVNNIFANSSEGFSYYVATNATSGITVSNFNILYTKGDNLAYWGANKTDLAALRASSAMDSSSRSFLPDFVTPKNLRVTVSDPVYTGTFVSEVTQDIDGKSRCVIPMIGGFEIPDPPKAFIVDFHVPDTMYGGGRNLFINSALASDRKRHTWSVDGLVITNQLNLLYSFADTGFHEVKLVSEGCQGIDSAVKQVYVMESFDVPVVDFLASNNRIYVNEVVDLFDLSTQAPTGWEWTILPDTDVIFSPFLRDPNVLFVRPGKYDVCLTAENVFGKSVKVCKPGFIEVMPLYKFCETQASSSDRKGRLVDDAGTSGTYGNNKNCGFLIDPGCSESLSLKIKSWMVEDNDDILFIYDGKTADPSKLLAAYSGSTPNAGGTAGLVAQSGSAYLIWVTDGSVVSDGFIIDWESVAIPDSVTAGFDLPDTGYVNSPVYITNTSGGAKTVTWDVEYPGAVDITEANGLLYHTYATPGTYQVKQNASGCVDTDTLVKTIVIVNPVGLPLVDFTMNRNVLAPGQTLVLTDISKNGPITRKWKISPSAGVNFTAGGDSSYQVNLTFNNTGYYDITLIVANANGEDSITRTSAVRVVEYCIPNSGFLSAETGISRVIFEGIDNTSTMGAVAYSDYTNNGQLAKVATGAQYDITIRRNSGITEMTRKVWIDWNQDGDFDNVTELVAMESFANTREFKASVIVPGSALPGLTRMRVGAGYQNDPLSPCSAVLIGEFEDYQVLVLGDREKPVITLLGNNPETVEAGYGYTDAGATAIDNVDGNITASIVMTGSVDTTTPGTYELVYTVKDAEGNSADTVRRTVIVTPDVTAPLITLLGQTADTIDVFSSFTDSGAVAVDQPWGILLTDSIKVFSNLDTAKLGTYTITYEVTDASGNRSFVTRTVMVRDTMKPVLTLKGNDNMDVEVNGAFTDPGVNATDNYWDVLKITVTGVVDTTVLGQYILEYHVVDGSGNESVLTRTVNVVDRTAPVIRLVGSDLVFINRWEDYADSGYLLSDNYYDSSSIKVEVLGDWVSSSEEGLFYIQYKATDSSGNVSFSEKRIIDVRGVSSTGNEPSLVNNINLYPNPNSGMFYVEIDLAAEKNTSIEVYDMTGRKVASTETVFLANGKIPVDLSNMAKGAYMVKVVTGNETTTRRVIITD